MPLPNSSRLPRELPRRLRHKTSLTDDIDWAGLNLEPDYTAQAIVGGTADDGEYIIDIAGTNAAGDPFTFQALFDRQAAETSAQVAVALRADFTAELAGDLLGVISSTSIDTATITMVIDPAATLTITATDPGTAVITILYDSQVTATVATSFPGNLGPTTEIEVQTVALDVSGNILPRGSCTYSLEGINVADRSHPRLGAGAGADPAVGDTAALDDVPLNRWARIENNGGRFTARLTNITSAPVGTVALEVIYREVTS
jgi:hypothetical protein